MNLKEYESMAYIVCNSAEVWSSNRKNSLVASSVSEDSISAPTPPCLEKSALIYKWHQPCCQQQNKVQEARQMPADTG